MTENILCKISANMDFFSNVERKLAEAILDNPEKIVTCSMAELSGITGISQGSINNFSNKICGEGYAGLKLRIASGIPGFKKPTFNYVNESDGIKDILKKSTEKNIVAFNNTVELNSEEVLKKAAEKILNSKKTELYGIFQSGLVAKDFYMQLIQLGLPASYVSDVLTLPVSASLLDEECLIIAISSSGRTKDILDAVKAGKENNVPVICITSQKNSPLAKISDYVLLVTSSEASISNSMNEVRLSQMFLCDALASYLRYKIDKDGYKQYYRISKIISSHSVND